MSKESDVEQSEMRDKIPQEKSTQELSDIQLLEGKRSKKGFLLRPQPSNDPNDPLVHTKCLNDFSVLTMFRIGHTSRNTQPTSLSASSHSLAWQTVATSL